MTNLLPFGSLGEARQVAERIGLRVVEWQGWGPVREYVLINPDNMSLGEIVQVSPTEWLFRWDKLRHDKR